MGVDELFAAIERGDEEAVEAMVAGIPGIAAARNHRGTSAVLWACFVHQPELAQLLAANVRRIDVYEAAALNRVPDLDALLEADPTLLERFGDDDFRPIHLAAMFGATDAVTALLAHGADPNAAGRDSASSTPLHVAATGGHQEVARLLLEAGANPNAMDVKGRTALHNAASTGDRPMSILLLNAGADYRLVTTSGESAADLARQHGYEHLADVLAP